MKKKRIPIKYKHVVTNGYKFIYKRISQTLFIYPYRLITKRHKRGYKYKHIGANGFTLSIAP